MDCGGKGGACLVSSDPSELTDDFVVWSCRGGETELVSVVPDDPCAGGSALVGRSDTSLDAGLAVPGLIADTDAILLVMCVISFSFCR